MDIMARVSEFFIKYLLLSSLGVNVSAENV